MDPTEKTVKSSLADLLNISRTIADTASDAIITIDENSVIVFVNSAAERIFGYPRDEMLGESLTLLIPDHLRQVHRAGLQRYLATGERHITWEALKMPGLHKSGREIPLELSYGEFTEDGQRFFTGIARDITERHRLEQRLTAQFQVARILAESDSLAKSAPALIEAICDSLGWEVGQLWIVDHEAGVLRWVAAWHRPAIKVIEFEEASRGRTFARDMGLPGRVWSAGAAQWIDDLADDVSFPRLPIATQAGLRSAFGFPITLGVEVSGVMEFLSRDGHAPDSILLHTVNSIGHQIGQFVERKRSEAERLLLFDQGQRARHEVEAAIDRMRRVQSVTDSALAHLSLDELLAELLDRVREAMGADTVAILLLESRGDELVAWAAKGLEEEVEMGVRIPVGGGFAGRVAAQKSPVRIDDIDQAQTLSPILREKGIKSLLGVPLLVEGRLIGVIHVGKLVHYHFTEDDTRLLQLVADRTALAIENARLFEEERAARREAEAASRAKDEFLTTISHELRTPLTPIIGWTHMLRNGMLPPRKTAHGLEVVEKNSHILKRLINDLLDMSAILSGKMRMEELPVNLVAVVREAVETVRPIAAAAEIEIDLKLDNCAEEIITGDRARLLQVFWNLLSNSIKFSSPGTKVRVRCEADVQNAVVRVEDSGQGIEPDFLPFVFERFRQEDGSKTRAHGGLGLGLALVKSFVQAHHGTVEAESQGPGQGSRFEVRLPLRSFETSRSDRPRDVPAKPPSRGHLMIIEDDPDTLEMLRATLETRGYQVTGFESATETLDVMPQNSVDLIISDIGMPVIDGLEMIRRLREFPGYHSVPAIALSGYASKKDAAAAVAAGFNAHVSKPVDPTELVSMIEQLLDKTSTTKQ
jgi:PAS domain S-box-containing protein